MQKYFINFITYTHTVIKTEMLLKIFYTVVFTGEIQIIIFARMIGQWSESLEQVIL